MSVLANSGVAPVGSSFELAALDVGSAPALPAGLVAAGAYVEPRLVDAQTGAQVHDLDYPIEVAYTPSADDLAQASGDPSRLLVVVWTGAGWLPAPCAPTAGALSCTVSHLGPSLVVVGPPPTGGAQDLDLPGGHFYRQANGFGGAGSVGYAVVDDQDAAMWSEFQRYDGVDTLGYPISTRFAYAGFVTQAFQKLALQWRPELGAAVPLNVLDDMNHGRREAWLEEARQVPPAEDTRADTGLPFEAVIDRHVALLDAFPALRDYYLVARLAHDVRPATRRQRLRAVRRRPHPAWDAAVVECRRALGKSRVGGGRQRC